MPHYRVDYYAMPNLVPCIMIGFESEAARVADADVVTLEAQSGGLACLHFEATGFVLRLAAATEFARQDPWPLVRAFQDMSDDVTHSEGPRATLAYGGGSSGEPMTREELTAFDRDLAPYFRLPPLESGYEAFARFDVVDVLAYFEDWPVWSLAARDGSSEPLFVWEPSIGDYLVGDDARFSRAHVAQLERIAAALSIDQPVRAFLFWGNSD